ncbi:MAG: hypothetical protein A2046_04845 [Bacteroidetes bacterium GWA2_30_7]|nr:MAG: hypothetical protein A2046_04845 [Bacteroidetes bacterium GWA2_30_7]
MLSPGPGIPYEAGILKQLIKEYSGTKSILGVCLGMQAIAEVFGCKLFNLENVFHGVATQMKIIKNNEHLFAEIPLTFYAGRYHSWVVSKESFPECLTITCEDTDGQIMGISHNILDVKGVQFHPESVMTPLGEKIIYNWLNS